MKLAHLSDIHAGYSSGKRLNDSGINLRLADGYVALNRMVTDIINSEVDVVLVAGDTFHSAHTDNKTIIYVQNQFRRFYHAGIPVYILAGNHDVTDVRTDIAISRILHDPDRNIESFIKPYEMRKISDNVVLHMVSHHAYAEQAENLLKVKPVEGMINIFSSHGSVINAETEEKLHTEASPREIVIPTALLEEGFDAALLGHIHERRFVNVSKNLKNKVFYNGSLIRRGYADSVSSLKRGWTLWNIDEETGTFTPEFKEIFQRPQYDFEIIDGSVLSSTEISEQIIENLKNTQVYKDFNASSAPILRQTIKDISLAKYSALDWAGIEENSKHSFNGLPIKKITSIQNMIKNKDLSPEIATNDIMKLYDGWAESSTVLDSVDNNFKERVIKQARRFMEQGREKTLDE